MQTTDGRPVYTMGLRYSYSLKQYPGGHCWQATCHAWDSTGNRNRRLKDAAGIIGVPCVWVKSEPVESIPVL
jgi:hypothetical protein